MSDIVFAPGDRVRIRKPWSDCITTADKPNVTGVMVAPGNLGTCAAWVEYDGLPAVDYVKLDGVHSRAQHLTPIEWLEKAS